MDNLIKDIKFAIRTLIKKPGFTSIAIVTLALGICASTTVFSVVDAVVLRPLPFAQPQRLVSIFRNIPGQKDAEGGMTQKVFVELRDRNQSFDSVASYVEWGFNLTGQGTPDHVDGAKVSADFFKVLGTQPIAGRTFNPGEDRAGANHEVVLSEAFWKSKFGSDRGIIGKTLNVDGAPCQIIGVMPASISFPSKSTNVWVPLDIDPQKPDDRYSLLDSVARLKPGLTVGQAGAELAILSKQFQAENPKYNSGEAFTVYGLHEKLVGDTRSKMLFLLGAVLFVLLIACANIANLQLARAASRIKEVAVRSALGASRGRLLRQLLTESILLSIVGGLVGITITLWSVSALRAIMPEGIPLANQMSVDGRVLLFAFAISVITGALFGLLPGLQASRVDVSTALKEEGRSVSGGRSRRMLSSIIGFEIAVSLVLLVCAGLMIRSFEKLVDVQPGFSAENLVAVQAWLIETKYPDADKQGEFARRMLERVSAMKDVQSSAAAMISPLSGSDAGTRIMPEGSENVPKPELPRVSIDVVTPGYFKTLGIQMVKGRDFNSADTKDSQKVVLISQAIADTAWPGADPIGKRINSSSGEPWAVVAGVVKNIRPTSLKVAPAPEIYLPYSQAPFVFPVINIFMKTSADPTALLASARGAVESIDPDIPIFEVSTMSDRIKKSVAPERFQLVLLAGFAALSILLAAVGLYGVVDYSVSQRTHEIGVRIALGAGRVTVFQMVITHTLKILLAGLACGLIGAFGLTRLMQSMLFQVGATDPATFIIVPLILAAVALVASFIPSRRASRVDPMIALRYE